MTLVELMVAISMFGVITVVVFTFLTNSRASYSDMSAKVEYQQSMRAVLGLVSREVRSAGCDPLQAGFDHCALATAATCEFRMDLDGDGLIEVAEPAEDVTYSWDPNTETLLRDNGGGPQVILRDVTALQFRYFDATGAALTSLPLTIADRARVRFLEIDITGRSERGEPLNYVTRVFVRNG